MHSRGLCLSPAVACILHVAFWCCDFLASERSVTVFSRLFGTARDWLMNLVGFCELNHSCYNVSTCALCFQKCEYQYASVYIEGLWSCIKLGLERPQKSIRDGIWDTIGYEITICDILCSRIRFSFSYHLLIFWFVMNELDHYSPPDRIFEINY